MKYRKKPVIITAIQWKGDNESEIMHFIGGCTLPIEDDKLIIPTLEGDMIASLNDYIIKGIRGECYPCKPDIFKETYEEC